MFKRLLAAGTMAASTAILLATTGVPADAAAPSFAGCEAVRHGRPHLDQDQYGTFVAATLSYRCSDGTRYSINATLYRNPDQDGGTAIASRIAEGTSTRPGISGRYGRCVSTRATSYTIGYGIFLDGRYRYHQPRIVTLACRVE